MAGHRRGRRVRRGVQHVEFEVLLDFIKQSRGFDFTGYKRPTLRRQIEKRMGAVGATNRRGRAIEVKVRVAQMKLADAPGLIVLVEDHGDRVG